MRIQDLTPTAIAANGNTDVELPADIGLRKDKVVVQIYITGTITIQLLGSLDGTHYVETLAASASGQLALVLATPYMRITASSTSGGTAKVYAYIPGPYTSS